MLLLEEELLDVGQQQQERVLLQLERQDELQELQELELLQEQLAWPRWHRRSQQRL